MEVQKHLEAKPWLLTGAHSLDPPLVISQFQLGSDFRPDFVFFWHNSGGDFIELIEIESPKLCAFNASDEFSQPFNHALQQVRDWPNWILQNQRALEESMEPLFDHGWIMGFPTFRRAKLFLVAGRRDELQGKPKRKARWEAKVADLSTLGATLRTWDGFASSLSLETWDPFVASPTHMQEQMMPRISRQPRIGDVFAEPTMPPSTGIPAGGAHVGGGAFVTRSLDHPQGQTPGPLTRAFRWLQLGPKRRSGKRRPPLR